MYQTIIDEKSNRLKYLLNLSENPMGCPLLVVLHGYGSYSTHFQYEGWNVLSPYDNFGYEHKGSWWLGEDGDFFLRDLLQKLIQEVSQKYNSEDKIYFYGSSMGGYGAILHGILSNARAVYSNVPQIQFYNSRYFLFFENQMKSIFGETHKLRKEDNLLNYLNKVDTFPIFFLCENMIEDSKHLKDYLKEHTLMFANRCYDYQIKLHLELLPYSGHTKNYGLKEVLNKFEKFAPVPKEINLKVNQYFKLDSKNWFLNKQILIEKMIFNNNSLILISSTLELGEILYISSGSSNLKSIGTRSDDYSIFGFKSANFLIEIEKMNNIELSFFIIEFNNKNIKISSKVYPLNRGMNRISHHFNKSGSSLKMAFRIYNKSSGTFSLIINDFNVKFFKKL
jgi:hypothetical protein